MERAAGAREYRVEELAGEAGITVRTLRFYRERKLLPPPRREGRIAWYDDRHLARLRTIAALLARGHTLNGIADLTTAFESVAATSANSSAAARTPPPPPGPRRPRSGSPPRTSPTTSRARSPRRTSPALDLGYLAVDGEEIVHISRRLLDVSAALVREGVPLAAVLRAGKEVREHATAMAEIFTAMVRSHLTDDAPDGDAPGNGLAAPLERLRPLAKSVVEAELSMALDRLIRAEKDL